MEAGAASLFCEAPVLRVRSLLHQKQALTAQMAKEMRDQVKEWKVVDVV